MIGARYGHRAVLLPDGRVLAIGGIILTGGEGDYGGVTELYDPRDGTRTATPNAIEVRHEPAATLLLDGKVLVAGGVLGGNSAVVELFDPAGGS